MNFLGLAVIVAALVSILCGVLGASYQKKVELNSFEESQVLQLSPEAGMN